MPEWRAPWSERVARWLVGGRDADAVAGDLSETGETGWNYWRQALSCFLVRISPHRRMIPDLRLDLRMAVRNIRRNPGYALTAVLCLGLAMGVNSTLFSFLDSVYFRRLPVPDARRVVRIVRDRSAACTWQEFLEMRAAARSLELTSVFRFGGSADIDRLNLGLIFESVSANYAQVLGLSTAMGRWFTSEEDLASAPAVVVISYRLWQSKLHGDPNVLGRQILVEELPFRIVGVAPEGFDGDMPPLVQDAWIPQASVNSQVGNNAGKVKIGLMGRLAPGASVAAAAAEIGVWDARLSSKKDDPLQVVPAAGFGGALGKRYLSAVLPMGSAVCSLVLLIACVNVANLLLGRAAVRRREIAVRLALGAGRARIFRETLTEGMVLAAGGVIAGLILGEWTGRALESALPSIPNQLYHGVALGADWRVALLLTAVGLVCALLFNLPAAFESGRCRINVNLHADVASQSGRQREFYSIAQVALSLALLVASGLVLRALQHVEAADPGFARDHRLLVDVYASPRAYKAGESQRLFTSLLDQARQIPGVLDATLALGPLGPAPGACASKSAAAPPVHVAFNTVEPNYFTMMRVPIVKGRGLTPSQSAEAVVSETMAHTWWPDGDALGKTFWTGCDAATRVPVEIVGVARDTRFALGVGQEPAYYVARQRQTDARSLALIIQTAGTPARWTKPLLQAVSSAGPQLRIYEIESLDNSSELGYWELKWRAALVGALGALAILLAAIGLYGVVAYAVSQRTREIGVRMALGASPGDVQWMVLNHGLRITAAGIAIGLVFSAAAARLLRGYLYGLSPFDPIAFGGACLAWIAIAMLASWIPSRRATRVDPLIALKWE